MGCSAVLPLLYTIIVFSKYISVTITDVVLPDDACLKYYFYNGSPPIYLNEYKNDIFICQKDNQKTYFVTRYSTLLKIPIYSAYQIKNISIDPEAQKITNFQWKTENSLNLSQQAKDDDYRHTGYNRGHLNPRCHNLYSQESLETTYSLTNAVPMIGEFNRQWYRIAENPLIRSMINYCNEDSYRRYIITGVIPGNEKMNKTANIPEYVWSAALCIDEHRKHGWSVGYWLKATDVNKFGKAVTIQQLEIVLQNLLEIHMFNNTTVLLFQNLPIYSQQIYSGENLTRPSRSCRVSAIRTKRARSETGRK